MSNYVAIVFTTESKAHNALRKLWNMDESGDLTVHGTAVVRRDDHGFVDVASRHTDAGMRTAVGIGVGMLLGALAGPVGVAAGVAGAAAAGVGSAIGVGAVAGGAIGLTADAIKSEDRTEAGIASAYWLTNGESAVVADISEDSPSRLDDVVKAMGGTIHLKYDTNGYIDNYDEPYRYYNNYLYPYYYDGRF